MGVLAVEDSEEVKRTNEIKRAIPLREAIDIQGKDVTADALRTQRELAKYRVEKRPAGSKTWSFTSRTEGRRIS